jgi:hypothetical protein
LDLPCTLAAQGLANRPEMLSVTQWDAAQENLMVLESTQQ